MRCGVVLLVAGVFVGMGTRGAMAQENSGVSRNSAEAMAAQAKRQMETARTSATGAASATLEKYPGSYTMLAVRVKSGGAEVHANWDDYLFVIDGSGTVMTGGTAVDAKAGDDGETRGTRVEGGVPTEMHKGDVIHIPAKLPHQVVLAPGETVTYYVIKVAAPKS
jgi:mannose-6-phosphate isomerase-like protein (cupin superfamily)